MTLDALNPSVDTADLEAELETLVAENSTPGLSIPEISSPKIATPGVSKPSCATGDEEDDEEILLQLKKELSFSCPLGLKEPKVERTPLFAWDEFSYCIPCFLFAVLFLATLCMKSPITNYSIEWRIFHTVRIADIFFFCSAVSSLYDVSKKRLNLVVSIIEVIFNKLLFRSSFFAKWSWNSILFHCWQTQFLVRLGHEIALFSVAFRIRGISTFTNTTTTTKYYYTGKYCHTKSIANFCHPEIEMKNWIMVPNFYNQGPGFCYIYIIHIVSHFQKWGEIFIHTHPN